MERNLEKILPENLSGSDGSSLDRPVRDLIPKILEELVLVRVEEGSVKIGGHPLLRKG